MESKPSIRAELNAISASDWSSTPSSVRDLLLRLIERMEQQDAEIVALKTEVALLKAENVTLREQVSRNSGNSSKPPSEDKGFKVSRKGKSGGSRGGVRGHEGHERFLYEVEDCAKVHEHYPEQCGVWRSVERRRPIAVSAPSGRTPARIAEGGGASLS